MRAPKIYPCEVETLKDMVSLESYYTKTGNDLPNFSELCGSALQKVHEMFDDWKDEFNTHIVAVHIARYKLKQIYDFFDRKLGHDLPVIPELSKYSREICGPHANSGCCRYGKLCKRLHVINPCQEFRRNYKYACNKYGTREDGLERGSDECIRRNHELKIDLFEYLRLPEESDNICTHGKFCNCRKEEGTRKCKCVHVDDYYCGNKRRDASHKFLQKQADDYARQKYNSSLFDKPFDFKEYRSKELREATRERMREAAKAAKRKAAEAAKREAAEATERERQFEFGETPDTSIRGRHVRVSIVKGLDAEQVYDTLEDIVGIDNVAKVLLTLHQDISKEIWDVILHEPEDARYLMEHVNSKELYIYNQRLECFSGFETESPRNRLGPMPRGPEIPHKRSELSETSLTSVHMVESRRSLRELPY